jgi:hypothetical protein
LKIVKVHPRNRFTASGKFKSIEQLPARECLTTGNRELFLSPHGSLKLKNIVLVVPEVLLCVSTALCYGENPDTLLNWQERAVAVLTNACRMTPTAYRDRFIDNSEILLPQKYPAVPPVYWNRELNAASRFHAVEMALDCGMQHESCNGDLFNVRIRKFYTKSGYIGENIASGYSTPQVAFNAWLIDGPSAQSAAPDGNGDGHRANIMSPRYKEVGCGYYSIGTDRNTKPYWCQDFGGGKSDATYHPVSAASHLYLTRNQITFMATIHDTAGVVSARTLLLGDERIPLELSMGSETAGTWEVSVPVTASCRQYAVEVAFTDGHTMRYPEKGTLVTVGEGSCTETSGSKTSFQERPAAASQTIAMVPRGDRLEFRAGHLGHQTLHTELIDCRGKVYFSKTWTASSGVTFPGAAITPGVWFFRHRLGNGNFIVKKWVYR